MNSMGFFQKIQQKIVDREYYLSAHAEEEMWIDDIERVDVEHAILKGRIEKKLTQDVRGTRHRIEGMTFDGRKIHVVCRLNEQEELVIITVYVLEVRK